MPLARRSTSVVIHLDLSSVCDTIMNHEKKAGFVGMEMRSAWDEEEAAV
jgi:hypothetical protein